MLGRFHYKDYSLIVLLFSLLAVLLIYPFFGKLDYSNVILNSFLSVIMIAAVRATTGKRIFMLIGLFLALLTLATSWGELVDDTKLWVTLSLAFNIIFLSYVIFIHLHAIMLSRVVTKNLLFGAVCVYILIGLMMSFVYMLIDIYYPYSFSSHLPIFGQPDFSISQHFLRYVYFSFVTLTTLGYGDMTPVSLPAQAFAYMEAIAGQFYLTILVARLIAVYVVNRGKINS